VGNQTKPLRHFGGLANQARPLKVSLSLYSRTLLKQDSQFAPLFSTVQKQGLRPSSHYLQQLICNFFR
jgi:hypothetical protein